MLIGIVIGLAGLVILGIAYVNRDPLSDKPLVINLAPYIVGAAFFIAIGIVVMVLTSSQTDICGGMTNCGYGASFVGNTGAGAKLCYGVG